MSTPKVSILVPVYNVERFLLQCLDALCGQTLRDIEIVCINDGATDGSPAILHEYAARDARVRAIDKPNTGYGHSLNLGISQARGEYIGIIEPDDFPDKRMFKKLLKVAERTHADVVKCNYFNYFEGSDHLVENFAGLPYRRAFDPVDYPQVVCSIPSIWTGLYRKTFLEREGISSCCLGLPLTSGESTAGTTSAFPLANTLPLRSAWLTSTVHRRMRTSWTIRCSSPKTPLCCAICSTSAPKRSRLLTLIRTKDGPVEVLHHCCGV